MASKLNHHFVPQYLFRFFSAGDRRIHLVTRNPYRLIFDASVKGQCARHKFYGTQEVEDYLAVLECRHAAAFRALLRATWDEPATHLSDSELRSLLEGLMLQRARVPRKVATMSHSMELSVLHMFRDFVKASPDRDSRDRILHAIERGQVKLKNYEREALLLSLMIALEHVPAIADLNLAVLRNFTDYPFVFGDSPCVFYNRYFYDVVSSGVLGYQSPGLMILMPVDCDTTVFLFDPKTYRVPDGHQIINVKERFDVSQLNALQVYSARNAVYFSDRHDSEYVTELVSAHRVSWKESYGEFRVHPPGTMLIDGKLNENALMHQFESQLPIRLDLTFVSTKKVEADDYPNRARTPELREALKEGEAASNGRVSAKAFVKDMIGDPFGILGNQEEESDTTGSIESGPAA